MGGLCALVHGAASPLMLLVYSMMTNTFVAYELEIKELADPNKTCTDNLVTWINGTVVELDDNATVTCGYVNVTSSQDHRVTALMTALDLDSSEPPPGLKRFS